MGYVNFDLSSCGPLQTLASPGPGIAGTLPPGMPPTGGLYLIFNSVHQSRYMGKAGNLSQRFTSRMGTVNELGMVPGDLAGVFAFWGDATIYNTPVFPHPAPPPFAPPGTPLTSGFRVARNGLGAAPVTPNAFLGTAAPAPNYGAPAVTTTIDGVPLNVEALLIRFFRQMGVGGTITNLQHIGPFQNPTPNELIVQAEWGAAGPVPAAHFCITIPGNGVF